MSPNRLINEKSPYLRMHAHNPIDWYPWCDEAFERARVEDKPIFLSIGYSSCHWCHVMEKESFNDPEIADILNRHFISIKVDREERPDVDAIYMKACLLFQMQGGWPLTVFLKPDKTPFYVDTYIPKDDRYGKAGLRSLLLRIAWLWSESRESIDELAEMAKEGLSQYLDQRKGRVTLSHETLHGACIRLRRDFDPIYKGFGKSQKFPMPIFLLFLHRYYYRFKSMDALSMSLETLERMRMGGIYDHIGYGFHRYSVDRRWKIPHFEKMLYDNALLMLSYLEAYQITRKESFADVVKEIASFLMSEMLGPLGAFYSAIGADSEGEEGKFYAWNYDELKRYLSDEAFEFLKTVFSISEEGDLEDELTYGEISKKVLFMKMPYSSLTEEQKLRLNEIRKKLFNLREKREKPLRDEKLLTDWNSLAIVAFAKSSVVFEDPYYLDVAKSALNFILYNLFDSEGRLYHVYAGGERKISGFLDDYAFFIWALIEMYFSTLSEEYIKKATELTDHVLVHFSDNEGAFFHVPDYAETVLFRLKETRDGVIPSGNSVMLYNLLRLYSLTKKDEYKEKVESIIEDLSQDIEDDPLSYLFCLIAFDSLLFGFIECVVSFFKDQREQVENYIKEIQKGFIPDFIPILKEGGSNEYPILEGKPTYYVCKNFSCSPPTTDFEALKKLF